MLTLHMIEKASHHYTLYFDGSEFSFHRDDALEYRDEDEAVEDANRVGGEVVTFTRPDMRPSSVNLIQAAE